MTPIPTLLLDVAATTSRWIAFWCEQRVVVELDGAAAHSSPARTDADRRRDLALRSAGYVARRYSWWQVTREAAHVVADLRPLLP